jgi:CRP-like cAMP-binding protein
MGRPARAGPRISPPGIPVRNHILAALLSADYKRLLPKLEHVSLTRGQVVYRADQKIDQVYFPEQAVIAMVDTTQDRRTVEVGIIGREGIVGINIFLGGVITPDRAIVQLAGGAMRMKSQDLRKEARFGSPIQRVLLNYTRTFIAVISQSVACSQHHNVEQRLARLLLTMHDYAGSSEFPMVQRSMAQVLGVRRVSVTHAARRLQAAGLIRYSRGSMLVLDEHGLENESCECYRYIRRQYEDLRATLPQPPRRK